jgi:pyruvate/2-oxoglutarate dehydrogenase complex dihydrolipoamide dehydrogenase (E3) component
LSEGRRAPRRDVVVGGNSSATFRLHPCRSRIIKLVAERGTGTLLGATVVGPGCGEVLGMLTLAVHARLPLSAMRNMIYAFPTFHGGVGEAIGAYGRGLSTVIDPEYRGLEVLDRP